MIQSNYDNTGAEMIRLVVLENHMDGANFWVPGDIRLVESKIVAERLIARKTCALAPEVPPVTVGRDDTLSTDEAQPPVGYTPPAAEEVDAALQFAAEPPKPPTGVNFTSKKGKK